MHYSKLDMESLNTSIRDVIHEAQKDAVESLVSGLNIDDAIRGNVKCALLSRVASGMNLKKLEVFTSATSGKDTLIFEVEI